MHFYQKNIGDFNNATRHLTRVERSLFSDAIELYYNTEKPLTSDFDRLCRLLLAHSTEEKAALRDVLNEFFTLTDDGYFNKEVEYDLTKIKHQQKNHWAKKLPKHIKTSIQAERNASKVNATPQWLTKSQRQDIANIYSDCALKTASTGIKHEVDHIVPLRSKLVCGLHVGWNLQVIESYKNKQKSNFFEVV